MFLLQQLVSATDWAMFSTAKPESTCQTAYLTTWKLEKVDDLARLMLMLMCPFFLLGSAVNSRFLWVPVTYPGSTNCPVRDPGPGAYRELREA